MALKQLNATYIPEEDRVMFRFTTTATEEYRLWLTRARVAEVLALGKKAAVATLVQEHPPVQAKAIEQFKQQSAQQSAQFTQFEPALKCPLGAEPILVKSLRLEPEGNLHALHLNLTAHRTLSLRLDEQMLSQLRVLLQTISDRAKWHLGESVKETEEDKMKSPTPMSGSSSGGAVLH